MCDQLEQHAGFGLTFVNVGQIVEDQQVVLVQLVDDGGQGQILACRLQALHEIASAGEQHPEAMLDQGVAQGRRQMRLARAGRGSDILPDTRGRTSPSTTPSIHGAASGSG